MAKFHYKFESIKKIKENLEKKVQKEVSVIELEIEKLNMVLADIRTKKDESRRNCFTRSTFKISELQFQEHLEELMDLQIEKIREEIFRMEGEKEKKLAELAQKSKENKIFETLKEKHFEEYVINENQNEQKLIDEIASTQFGRES